MLLHVSVLIEAETLPAAVAGWSGSYFRGVRRALLDVGHPHGIEHGPQYIQLELQNAESPFLFASGPVVIEGDIQPVLDIATGL
jgi:hypothetical protein